MITRKNLYEDLKMNFSEKYDKPIKKGIFIELDKYLYKNFIRNNVVDFIWIEIEQKLFDDTIRKGKK